MNPDTLTAARLRAFALSLGLAAFTTVAPAQTATPAPATEIKETQKPAPVAEQKPETVEAAKIMKLETYRVLGSRIRQSETEGPSPVTTYNSDYIKATGAFTLADFLNQIPQNYGGVAFGRNSAPNELNPEFGQRTETTTPSFNFVLGSSAAPPGQTGANGISLRGLGSGSTLVLVDGRRVSKSPAGNRSSDTRQGFFDLNTIPLGMVESIEVTADGSSAIYGADAVGGVINIVLKKNYNGTEISGGFKTAEHGGGRERSVTVTSGFARGKLSGLITLDYFDRADLKGSQRRFAKNQDHTGVAAGTLVSTGAVQNGRDFRLTYGFPAVIQAAGGVVSGNFDAIPGVRVVLVPEGSTGTPTPGQFVPVTTPAPGATVVNAAGQRRLNTAPWMDLIPESERVGFLGNLTYKFSDTLEAFAAFRSSRVRSFSNAQLAGNSITGAFGAAATLPAAFNPFNQNVTIGMVLTEWGPATQRVQTDTDALTASLRGQINGNWQWEVGVTADRSQRLEVTRSYNGAGFIPLMTNADPAKRFNPFIDYRVPGAPSQAALLETLSTYPTIESDGEGRSVDFTVDGELFQLWGGPVKTAFGGVVSRDEVESTSVNYSAVAVPVATTTILKGTQSSHALFSEFSLPFIGKENSVALVERFEVQIAGRYEEVGPFSKFVPKLGLSWAPVKSVLVRGSWGEGFRAPGVTEYLIAPSVRTATINDPRRTPTATTGVNLSSGSNPDAQPELSENTFVGVIYEPEFVPGLSLQVNYHDTLQKDTLQILSAQNIVNNEALFADRITRAAPDPTDTALGQPGRITDVEGVFVSYGRMVNRSVDFGFDYVLPWQNYGRWTVNFSATRTLESTQQLAPGQPAIILEEDTGSPPKWRYNAAAFWRKGNWNASTFLSYTGGFRANSYGNTLVANSTAVVFYPTPAVTKLDVRGGYEFKNGVWRNYGKGLRVSIGVNNVFDKEPPFSDTVWGFNAGLHNQFILGRAYEFSFALPF